MFYKVKSGTWGEGYKPGDIIEAEPHAMVDRVAKGEVIRVGGGPSPITITDIPMAKAPKPEAPAKPKKAPKAKKAIKIKKVRKPKK